MDARQAEVQKLSSASFSHEDVGWLDVTVDDAFVVCGIQCVGQLHPETQHVVDRQRTSCHHFCEVFTLQ